MKGCLILLLLSTCKDKNGITNNNLFDSVISQISPDSGRLGTEITITGINFGVTSEENTVTFNGIEAEVPKGAETGAIEVTVTGQTAAGLEFAYLFTPVVSTLAGTDLAGFDDGPGDMAHLHYLNH